MKKASLLIVAVLALVFSTSVVNAQFNPYSDQTVLLSAGIGVSGWGVPLFARLDYPVAENITVGGGLSYQSYSRFGLSGYSLIGIQARGNYHFNELFELSSDEFDLYGGASLGYYIYNTPSNDIYSSMGGFSFGIQAGARYFLTEKLAFNAEFGGGSVISAATIGVTFLL